MDFMTIEEFIGSQAIVDLHEGEGILGTPDLEIHGMLADVRYLSHPKANLPGTYESLELRAVLPRGDRFEEYRVLVYPRGAISSLWETLKGKAVGVSLRLYGSDGVLRAQGSGRLRPIFSPPTEKELDATRENASKQVIADLERIALESSYPAELRLRAKEQLVAIASDNARPESMRSRAREAARRAGAGSTQ